MSIRNRLSSLVYVGQFKQCGIEIHADHRGVAQGARSNVVKSSGASGVESFGETTGISEIRIGQLVAPTDGTGRLLVHFTRHEQDRYIPAWMVLDGRVDLSPLAGQIILVGTSAAGLRDIRATPLEQDFSGVEVHAQVLEQIISQDFLYRPDFATGLEIFYILFLGLALIWLLPRIGAVWSLAIGCLATVIVVIGSFYLVGEAISWLEGDGGLPRELMKPAETRKV